MKKIRATLIAMTLSTFLVGFAAPPLPLLAQDAQDNSTTGELQPDPNQPGVARVSYLRGDVSTQRGDTGDWVAVTQNTPISVGDRVSTGSGARTELQLDFANVLRMSDNSTAKMANLSRSQIQVQVGQGLVTYTALKGTEATAEIDTPNVAIRPLLGEGEFRILVTSDSQTQVTVRHGSAEIVVPQGSTRVDSGQMITIQGADNPQYQTAQAYAPDDWDRWVSDRDNGITHAQSWRHTNRYYTGSEDLDSHGTWSEVPDYGQVWRPNYGPDWTPYSSGRWVYEPYYGWTWVSYEPWGWAPYHYGRWFVYDNSWVWWPGPVVAYPAYYPIWAPAYVSFFGFGHGFGWGVGFGFGGFGTFGWLPLGPGDWCHPWWGGFGRSVTVVNVNNITINNFNRGGFAPLGGRFHDGRFSNIRDAETNARVRAGLHTMASDRFGREAFNGRGERGISASEFHQASAMTGKMPASPTKASFNPSGRAASASTIRSGSANSQHFFSPSHMKEPAGTQASRGMQSSPRTGETPRSQGSGSFNRPGNEGRGSFSAPRNEGRSTTPSSSANRGGSVSSGGRNGWRTFTPPSGNRSTPSATLNSRRGSAGSPAGRGESPRFSPPARESRPSASNRGFSSPSREVPPSASNRGFTPPSHESRPAEPNRSFTPPTTHESRPSAPNRGFTPPSGNSGRPALNMHQPIVTPRGSSDSRGGSFSAPRGGGFSAPRGGSAPSSHGGGGSPHSSGGSHSGANQHSGHH